MATSLVSNPASIKRMEKKKKKQALSEKKAMKHAQSKVPKFLILCGFPGSGKSTFAKEMVLNGSGKFVRCNQDELGKKACMNLLSKHANGNKDNAINRATYALCGPYAGLAHALCGPCAGLVRA